MAVLICIIQHCTKMLDLYQIKIGHLCPVPRFKLVVLSNGVFSLNYLWKINEDFKPNLVNSENFWILGIQNELLLTGAEFLGTHVYGKFVYVYVFV